MKLNTREWGSGDRIALLVHGIMSDSRTWRRVGPALAERGYRAVAVDLRGHGESGRSDSYPTEAYAADVVETVEDLGDVDLAIGYSLGGLALLLAAEELRPAKAVYVDPAWRVDRLEDDFDPTLFVEIADWATAESIAATNPRWEPEDVAVEVETFAVWDRQTALDMSENASAALEAGTAGDGTGLPLSPVVPSLVTYSDSSELIREEDVETLRERGFTLRVVPGTGHSVYRDDFEGFMSALEGWI
jgi:pimeloyl-ACP methyl ester carboxylesterase